MERILAETDLLELLQNLKALFASAQKAVAFSGHHETMLEIDALIGVASEEVRRKIRSLELKRNGQSGLGLLDVRD